MVNVPLQGGKPALSSSHLEEVAVFRMTTPSHIFPPLLTKLLLADHLTVNGCCAAIVSWEHMLHGLWRVVHSMLAGATLFPLQHLFGPSAT